ncbi:MAG TPA: DUF1365 domain-containing protein [Desulfofustis sp.]|jgi:DUF1365 family protein|nr:DUF1365 domain-containing protein [Desulfofustis sp. PB-SRB1]HBH28497.1 DUF1365 domain-containing protein [Desulfofustis sp.]
MNAALYTGTVTHNRFIPKKHGFSYRFFMWFLNLDRIDQLPDVGRWLSSRRFALTRYYRPDYFGDPTEPLHISVKNRLHELTGTPVTGDVYGLLNLRSLGLYFSPVNFYFGYNTKAECTHLLAEVSNTPWNERHCYGHVLAGDDGPNHPKVFKVSPFNPVNQHYRWYIEAPSKTLRLGIHVSDERGHVFTAGLNLIRRPFEPAVVKRYLLKKPVMTAFMLTAIYWQALKLYCKKVPYVPYQRKTS